MSKRKIVVALGGNAILSENASAEAQQAALQETAKHLVEIIKQGDELIISHGNGPQVGNLLLQQQAADSTSNPAMPLDTCVAMTQGSIGYWLQNALENACMSSNIEKSIISVITQVVVDSDDEAFIHPTKPIGPFLSQMEAHKQMLLTDATYKEDAGRGWRKVVPSPKPVSIQEYPIIDRLVEQGVVTISVGGGGIPVIQKDNELIGIEAVIDKDFASQKLAELVKADLLIILTGVDNVYVNYNQPNQKALKEVTTTELYQYIQEHQFAQGSMLPKIEAAIAFVENSLSGKAVITSLENLSKLATEQVGTLITKG
ncbi:carbamate kinase [Carnobacterium gallinarum]|uniref:carbamate kinase n=1 Tax=Carnobacterium gallinarum TaxID=2749 RepID=UPI00055386B4|nr:carbamate kinase [Carnobacterium gallinarum]